MDMQRRDFLKTLAALAAAGAVPPVWAAGREAFTVYGAPAMPSVIIAVAAAQGQLAKQADVSLQIWRTPDQLRAGVAGGRFKVMMSPSNVGVNLRNQGRKVGMVNILTNGIVELAVKKPIPRPQDLIGKKILIPFKNDMPDIVLQALLKKLGIDFGRVQASYAATPAEAVGLFLTRDFDGVLLAEPMVSACIMRGKAMNINVARGFNITQAWGQAFGTRPLIPQAGLIADADYFRANKAKFDLFHQDLKAALAWIKAHPQEAAQIGKNFLPAPVPALAAGLPHANLTVTAAREIKGEVMKFYEELLRFNPRLLGGRLPDDAFFLA